MNLPSEQRSHVYVVSHCLIKVRFLFLEGGGAEGGSLSAAVGSSDSEVEAELIIGTGEVGCAHTEAGRGASQANVGAEDTV